MQAKYCAQDTGLGFLLFNPAQTLPSFPGLWHFGAAAAVAAKHGYSPGFQGHLTDDGKEIY